MSDIEMESLNGDEDEIDMTDVKGLESSEEEGELSDSDVENSRSVKSGAEPVRKSQILKSGGHWTKKEEGVLGGEGNLEALYQSLGLQEGSEARRHSRLDTLHLRGIHNMDTSDVFHYFESHKPLFLEWVDDKSCNIVWPDDVSAARALLFYSSKHDLHETKPPPGIWRLGTPHPKAEQIYLRFATRSDKNVIGKDKLKVLPKKYKEASLSTGLISKSLKEQIKTIETDPYTLDEEKVKNPWGELCQTWGINDSQEVFGLSTNKHSLHDGHLVRSNSSHHSHSTSIKERIGRPPVELQRRGSGAGKNTSGLSLKMRLGKRPTLSLRQVEEDSYDQDDESSEEEWRSRSKVPRMRMHADDEQEKVNRTRTKSIVEDSGELLADNITVEIQNDVAGHAHKHRDRNRTGHSKDDLRARLRRRRKGKEGASSESEENSDSGSVWSRLDVKLKQEDSHSEDDLADVKYLLSKTSQASSLRPGFEKSDLRSRLNRKKTPASPLRIEVDNDHYSRNSD